MDYWTIFIQIALVLGLGYYFLNKKNNYWSDRGVKGPKPFLLLGNIFNHLRHGQFHNEPQWKKEFGNVYGVFMGTEPRLTITDPELIKQVLVKDFSMFVNRDVQKFDHKIWSKNLFNSEGDLWRRVRAITSPSFTSGKLKGMHGIMNDSVDKLASYFNRVIQNGKNELNMKETITGFTVDVIASTSFATVTDANGSQDQGTRNVFLDRAIKLFELNLYTFFTFISFFTMPKWFNKRVGAELGFSIENFNFFVNLSKTIIKQRMAEGGKVKRNDLVQLLIDSYVYEDELQGDNYDKLTATADNDEEEKASNGHANGSIKRKLTEDEIIAQCIIFFVAGFETTATTLSNALYFLSTNPEIQDRLANELDQALESLEEGSQAYFDKVNTSIPFLEATIKETLRYCPPVARLQRRVGVDNYKLAGIALEKDTCVEIGALAVHHSEEFYPEPSKFNPDRFMPENKHKLVPYTYLPFGAGPRNCIGMRFAYQEIRLCLAKIIREFKFSPTTNTKIPPDYNKIGILSFKTLPLKVSKR